MARNFKKRNLTTGDIAKLCGVNFRTVIRWIQRGHLKAFQLPGRGDNRVQVADFIEFLNENNMPIPEELQPSAKKGAHRRGGPEIRHLDGKSAAGRRI